MWIFTLLSVFTDGYPVIGDTYAFEYRHSCINYAMNVAEHYGLEPQYQRTVTRTGDQILQYTLIAEDKDIIIRCTNSKVY